MGFKKNIIFKQPKPLSHVIPVAAEGALFCRFPIELRVDLIDRITPPSF